MPSSLMVLQLSTTAVLPCRRVLISARLIRSRTSPPFARLVLRLQVASRITNLLVGLAGSAQDLRAPLDTHPAVRSTQTKRLLAILRRRAIPPRRLAWVSPALVLSRHLDFLPPVRRSLPHHLLTRLRRLRMDKLHRRLHPTLRRRLGSHPHRPTTALHHQASVRLPLLSALRHRATAQLVLLSVALAGTFLLLLLLRRSIHPRLRAGLLRVLSSILLLRRTLLDRQRLQEDQLLLGTVPLRQHTALRKFFCCPQCLIIQLTDIHDRSPRQ